MLFGGATLLPYIGALDVGFTLSGELVGILAPARGPLAGLVCLPLVERCCLVAVKALV